MAVTHRVKQGLRGLFAFTREVDYDLVGQYLPPVQLGLFRRMSRGEQLHSIQVLRDVMAQGDTQGVALSDDLAQAALLHDAGKSRYPMAVWQKTLPVLVSIVAPNLSRRLAKSDERNGFVRPFVVHGRHPRWGAELLEAIGASERLIWLVAHHADKPEVWASHPYYELLIRLQRADNAN